jgi:hypothetical protein
MCRLFRVLESLIVSLHKPAAGCLWTILYARVEVFSITLGPHKPRRVAILKGTGPPDSNSNVLTKIDRCRPK